MSQINVNNIRAKDGVGAVGFPGGINATGVVTATTFSGNLTGNVTGAVTGNLTGNADTATSATVATNAQGLTGTPNINVGNVVAVDGTFSGNVSIAGTLTYNDVTNIDSIGIVTARDGIVADGFKIEEGAYGTAALNGLFNLNLTDGHVQEFNAATSGNYVPNFRISPSVSLGSKMGVGDVTAATIIVQSSSHYCLNEFRIDGAQTGITTSWIGGSAPSAANGSGFDIYAFTIMKTSATPTYHIIANATSAA
jgi:hypothetical protein